jgi:hypothetical protein
VGIGRRELFILGHGQTIAQVTEQSKNEKAASQGLSPRGGGKSWHG